MLVLFIALSLVVVGTLGLAPHGPWDQFNFAPQSRASRPTRIHSVQGNVQNANALVSSGTTSLNGNGSFIVLDFGQEVNKTTRTKIHTTDANLGRRSYFP